MKLLDNMFSYLFGQKYVIDGVPIRVKKTKNGTTISTPSGIVSIGANNSGSVRYNDLLIEFNEFGIFVNGEKLD